MSLLLISEIRGETQIPDFGLEFAERLARKTNPAVRRASLTAWSLLAAGLARLRSESVANSTPIVDSHFLPAVRFGKQGKPEFIDFPLHFSLAHSDQFAVALLSPSPCGVDVEKIRPEVAERLRARCLSPEEQRLGLDFFECWTKKECVGKLTGDGIDAHPAKLDTLDPRWANCFYHTTLTDTLGQTYALSALCEGAATLRVERV